MNLVVGLGDVMFERMIIEYWTGWNIESLIGLCFEMSEKFRLAIRCIGFRRVIFSSRDDIMKICWLFS